MTSCKHAMLRLKHFSDWWVNVCRFHLLCRQLGCSPGTWTPPYQKDFSLENLFVYKVCYGMRLPIGYFWKHGMTPSLGETSDICKLNWPPTHLSPHGVVPSSLLNSFKHLITGRQMKCCGISRQKRQLLSNEFCGHSRLSCRTLGWMS